jgi:DNA polymerase III alpha subunit
MPTSYRSGKAPTHVIGGWPNGSVAPNGFEMSIDEKSIMECVYRDIELTEILTEDPTFIEKYNQFAKLFDIGDNIKYEKLSKLSKEEYIKNCLENWNLPVEYESCNIKELLSERCITDIEKQRVEDEYIEFEKRGLIPVLKFLNYFVETLRKNNIVWGVGRGSSVASYCLYLLGVHKIDSIKYNLDMEEFLK